MNEDERRALAIVAVLLASVSGSAGFLGGRMSVEPPPPEVKLVRLPPRVLRVLPAEPIEPAPASPQLPAPAVPYWPVPPLSVEPVAPIEPAPPPSAPPPETKPPAAPPVKAESKPQPRPKSAPRPQPKAEPKPHKGPPSKPHAVRKEPLPSCAVVKREYDAMTYSQRMSAYFSATPEEIAHGKRCLGL